MPLDFPNSPAVNDTFTSNGRTWKYTGTAWDLVPVSHTHAMSTLVDFNVGTPATGQTFVFDGSKWANSAALPQASVSGLTTTLAGKSDTTHTHNASQISTSVTFRNGSYWLGEDNPTNGRVIVMTSSSASTFTVQTYLANVGDRMDVIQAGTGDVTFVAGGVTLRMPTGKTKLAGQWSAATIICITAGSEYVVIGNLA